jgi:hypothetical protein
MPYGFFTVEKWRRPKWVAVCHLPVGNTLSDAIEHLVKLGKPGFYRITQTQRMILAEMQNGKLRLRKWHVGTMENLARSAKHFDRDHGKWPGLSAKKRMKKKVSRKLR